jgi:hypothetical protein
MNLADHLVSAPVYSSNGMYLGGPSYPCVMVVCSNCGYTMFHNAVVIGVVPRG